MKIPNSFIVTCESHIFILFQGQANTQFHKLAQFKTARPLLCMFRSMYDVYSSIIRVISDNPYRCHFQECRVKFFFMPSLFQFYSFSFHFIHSLHLCFLYFISSFMSYHLIGGNMVFIGWEKTEIAVNEMVWTGYENKCRTLLGKQYFRIGRMKSSRKA